MDHGAEMVRRIIIVVKQPKQLKDGLNITSICRRITYI